MADEGGDGVLDRSPGREHPERLWLERQHLAVVAEPVVGVALVAAVRGVHRHEDVGLDHLLPEGVELRQTERPRTAETGDGSRADQDDSGATLDHPLELLDRPLHDRERDDRRGEDPTLVVELPRLVHPLVQGVDHRVDELGVVPHPLLHEAGQRREHEGPIDALLIHQLQASGRVAEGRDRPHRLAEDLPPALAFRVAEAEVVLLRSRTGHHLERGVRDVVADLTADHDLRPAPDLDVVDRALVAIRQVLRQRVLRLVQVVVSIEHRAIERRRGHVGLLTK